MRASSVGMVQVGTQPRGADSQPHDAGRGDLLTGGRPLTQPHSPSHSAFHRKYKIVQTGSELKNRPGVTLMGVRILYMTRTGRFSASDHDRSNDHQNVVGDLVVRATRSLLSPSRTVPPAAPGRTGPVACQCVTVGGAGQLEILVNKPRANDSLAAMGASEY